MLTAEGGWGTTQGEPRTQNGGGSGGSSSENVCVPNRCVVRNELGEGKCALVLGRMNGNEPNPLAWFVASVMDII
ncbi:hypothetical protein E5288_WYG019779 [Bos mutus]|uniref:Uncharacterized protein n=1 Tax=Bos mutus TaxID=72004 RepID=A0A6B0RNW9_9CETA|nr:hypothetical protein [Bos mutus]